MISVPSDLARMYMNDRFVRYDFGRVQAIRFVRMYLQFACGHCRCEGENIACANRVFRSVCILRGRWKSRLLHPKSSDKRQPLNLVHRNNISYA